MTQQITAGKIYCDTCRMSQPIKIDPIGPDVLNGPKNWGDICCSKCHLVIATVEAEEPGIYEFVKVKDNE